MVADDGKVQRRTVELLKFDANSVVISRGLAPGEKVVTAGINSLAEGKSVKPETETASVNSLAENKSVKPQTEVE